ncbi:hypothetical protein GCM10029976_020740 [Kribbella albertanoniae]|uniref:F5/8 type C domain-containing protein n=1 Tax=Kribbella albertanoniae TaxID=1266829 RepID=A0A4R4QAM2_9ACTN|nr:AbfB domain-containing protein [Kribbella albertanoniae]TDC32374.1 hypothetical protein E1261_08465 [Kribbella albertanoniae]
MRLLATALTAALLATGLHATATAAPAATAATAATTLTADFSVDKGSGYAEVFGSGINVPALTDTAKIDTLHQAGTRFIRGDAYLQQILPRNTSIDAYLASLGTPGSVSDPNTWDWSKYAWVDEHHKRGTKTILILSYSIDWLGYNGSDYSPPKGEAGFRVYEDVIKKIYQRFRGKVDLIEVWNEPDLPGFLQMGGSPWGDTQNDRMAAYSQIYQRAYAAVRSVDADIPIGGPTVSNPGQALAWVDKLLADPALKNKFDFLSYHEYNPYTGNRTEPVETFRQHAAAQGRPNIPVYVTEWNYSAAYERVPMNASDARNLSYSALRMTNLYNQRANGANVFADNDEAIEPNFFGVHSNGMLPARARAYQLLSRDLGLGDGVSTLRQVSTPPNTFTGFGAATTASGDNVSWVVNDTAEPLQVDLQLTGLGSGTSTVANLFEASPNQNPVTPKSAVNLTITGGAARVTLRVPPYSVSGVRLGTNALSNNLAPSATATASSVSKADPELVAANVLDGNVGLHGGGEWASDQELSPNLTLTWPSAQTVGRIVLFDRANPEDTVRSGRLVFSDGSVVPIPELPNSGLAKDITFAPRSTTSVRLELTGAGLNVGLSEIQVYDGADVAREGTITAGTGSPYNAIDSRPSSEWRSTETNPWIRIDWVNTHQLDRVVLNDRPDPAANITSGTFTFSDGTSLAVTGIPADGSAKVVSFPAKSVTWVKFTATGSGSNVGLSQLRVLSAPNLASSAAATASSTYRNDPAYGASAATDGVVNQWFAGEWASDGEVNPKLTLAWSVPQRLSQVILFDRSNLEDQTRAGTLTFSDGSKVAVSGLDNTGTGLVVNFPARTTTSVLFETTGGQGLNNGIAEIQAFAVNDTRRIESVDEPGKFWRHRNGLARIDVPGQPEADFDFRIVAGLADRDAVSFQSVNYPGDYLRHADGLLRLNAYSNQPLYRADATFHPDGRTFRAHNYPTDTIRHTPDGQLRIGSGGTSAAEFIVR